MLLMVLDLLLVVLKQLGKRVKLLPMLLLVLLVDMLLTQLQVQLALDQLVKLKLLLGCFFLCFYAWLCSCSYRSLFSSSMPYVFSWVFGLLSIVLQY
jgi:hypothetical protein